MVRRSVALPREDEQQVQQADEDVVHAEEQVQRGHHVVRLAAADDVGEVVQQVQREDQHGDRRDRHRQRRDLQEDVRERRDDQQDQADEQELAQEGEVALGHRRVGRQREEDRRGQPAGQRDQLPAVPESGGDGEDRRQHQARDEREAEEREDAPRAVRAARVTTNSEPIIAPNISSGVMIGAALNSAMKLSCMPASAPATVGSIDSASSQ